MKALVTGGSGFIGSHIAETLVKRGDKVRVLDNLSTGAIDNMEAFLNKVEFVGGDLRNEQDVEDAVAGIDVIFHQAALRSVERSVDDPLSTYEVNVRGTLNLLTAARRAGVQRVVYASSSSVYGDSNRYPQNENFVPSPASPYAVSKLSGEHYCMAFARTTGLEAVALRYFNVFGPRQHPETRYAAVIPEFMQSIVQCEPLEVHGDGKQSRDFTYIDNVVAANLLAAETPNVSGEVFNVACGNSYSLFEVVRHFEEIVGRSLEYRYKPARRGDVRKTWADISRSKERLRFEPRINFPEGLRLTWEWFIATYRTEVAAVGQTRHKTTFA
jgi:UDP-glucose 4-epimerase